MIALISHNIYILRCAECKGTVHLLLFVCCMPNAVSLLMSYTIYMQCGTDAEKVQL